MALQRYFRLAKGAAGSESCKRMDTFELDRAAEMVFPKSLIFRKCSAALLTRQLDVVRATSLLLPYDKAKSWDLLCLMTNIKGNR